MASLGKRFSRQDIEVEDALILLAQDPSMYGKAQIHRALQEQFGEDRVPSERTVARLVDKARVGGQSQPWHWSDFPPDDARILLEVINSIIQSSLDNADNPDTSWVIPKVLSLVPDHFQTAYISDRRQAEWVVKIARVAPGLGPWAVYWVNLIYVLHEKRGISMSGIDTFLAMRPWQDMAAARRYLSALYEGRIPPMSQYGIPLVMELMDRFDLHPSDEQPPPVMGGDEPQHQEEE